VLTGLAHGSSQGRHTGSGRQDYSSEQGSQGAGYVVAIQRIGINYRER